MTPNPTTVAERENGLPAHHLPGPEQPTPGELLKASLRELLSVAMNRVVGLAMDKVDQAVQSLEQVSLEGGPKIGALVGGLEAKLLNKNPVWGAMKARSAH